jgi:hypothetical protein
MDSAVGGCRAGLAVAEIVYVLLIVPADIPPSSAGRIAATGREQAGRAARP